MIAALLLAGLSAIALGAAFAFVLGLPSGAADTGRGRGRGRACRVLGARFWRHARCGLCERARSALRRRRAERALPRHARAGRSACTPLLAQLPAANTAGTPGRRSERSFRARAGACRLRPRSAHLSDRLGADDAALGERDPRRPARRPALATDGLQLPRGHPSRRGWNLGRCAVARERGCVRRLGCDRGRLGAADRDRLRRAHRDGDEGGSDAAARLASARSSDRTGAGFGADERRDDQGRALRARAGARRVGRRSAGLVRRARARARGALCASEGSSTRSSSTT